MKVGMFMFSIEFSQTTHIYFSYFSLQNLHFIACIIINEMPNLFVRQEKIKEKYNILSAC